MNVNIVLSNNDNVLKERKGVKGQLDDYYKEKSSGYQVRSRAKWVEQGEQSTKYFSGLEKTRQHFNCISSLKDCNGITLTTDKEILEVAKSTLICTKANLHAVLKLIMLLTPLFLKRCLQQIHSNSVRDYFLRMNVL